MFPELASEAGAKSDERRTLTLAEAIARRNVVEKVLSKDDPFLVQRPVLITQPVATNWMKTAANAGATFSDACLKGMRAEGEQETKLASRLIETECRIDLQALNTFLQRYSKPKASTKNPGVLPSLHFTSSLVARCLYEMRQRNFDFIVPFINIVALGTVSYSSSGKYAVRMFEKHQLKFTSFASVLAQQETLHAMEAALLSISDLPETDIVRCAQYATRLRRKCLQARPSVKKRPRTELESDPLLLKAQRVMLCCVTASVDSVRLVQALNSIPMSDVKELLIVFAEVILQLSTRPFDLSIQSSAKQAACPEPENYRGTRNWIDGCFSIKRERKEIKGCIEWVEAVIDSHLASILLDSDLHVVVEKLLTYVSQQRSSLEALSPVAGALEHLQLNLPTLEHKELYRSYNLQVKASLWLQE